MSYGATSATSAAIAELEQELAKVARDTARLLLEPGHDTSDLRALEIRAAALRARITAAYRQTRSVEPVELRRSHGGALLLSGG